MTLLSTPFPQTPPWFRPSIADWLLWLETYSSPIYHKVSIINLYQILFLACLSDHLLTPKPSLCSTFILHIPQYHLRKRLLLSCLPCTRCTVASLLSPLLLRSSSCLQLLPQPQSSSDLLPSKPPQTRIFSLPLPNLVLNYHHHHPSPPQRKQLAGRPLSLFFTPIPPVFIAQVALNIFRLAD